MNRKSVKAIAGAAAATLAVVLVAPGAAGAATRHKIPIDSAHLGKSTRLSRTHLHPGRVTFVVHSAKGAHTLQIARLHKGYSLGQANQDIGAGFGGSAAAIRRVDKNVSFYGGSEGKPGKPGRFTVNLPAGKFIAINFDSGAYRSFTVSGAKIDRKTVHYNSRINMLSYGFDTHTVLARSGYMRLKNISDQPHFIVFQRIKEKTTHAQIKKALMSNSNSKPKFVLSGSTDSGVLSPYKQQVFRYRLPAGKYVIACFWPDDDSGMPHAAMGMFKVIHLR